MDAALQARLSEIAGDTAVDAAAGTVAPGTSEQVEQVCAACAAAGTQIAVTSLAPAKTSRRAEGAGGPVLVSLARLNDIAVEPERLVLRAGAFGDVIESGERDQHRPAGATLTAVRQAAEKAGLTLTGVHAAVPGDTTVGELIARGLLTRRALTGIEAVLPGGDRVTSGGSMLKDVAGYDLPAILLGSMGQLALVTAATLRLQPRTAPQDAGDPAGVPTPVLGDALQLAFDPQRLLVAQA
jgi:glycolate oxidase